MCWTHCPKWETNVQKNSAKPAASSQHLPTFSLFRRRCWCRQSSEKVSVGRCRLGVTRIWLPKTASFGPLLLIHTMPQLGTISVIEIDNCNGVTRFLPGGQTNVAYKVTLSSRSRVTLIWRNRLKGIARSPQNRPYALWHWPWILCCGWWFQRTSRHS